MSAVMIKDLTPDELALMAEFFRDEPLSEEEMEELYLSFHPC